MGNSCDDCQCGDVNGSGDVTTADALIIRRSLFVPPTATMSRSDLCDVGGSAACVSEPAASSPTPQARGRAAGPWWVRGQL